MLKGKALNQNEKDAFVKNTSNQSKEQTSVNWKEDELYRPLKLKENKISGEGSVEIELIPYYAWANRGLSYMDVWIPLAR